MTAGAQYQNELQQFWSSLPGEVQSALDFIYNPVNDALEWVCGDPDDLMRAAAVYTQLGPLVGDLSTEVGDARAGLQGHWEGPDYDAFLVRVTELEDTLTALGEGVSATTDILEAASEAAVESADAIIGLIKMVLAWLLSSFLISAALSVITFGASVVAWAANAVASGAAALARVSFITARMAAFLQRVIALMQRLVQLMRQLKEILNALKLLVSGLRNLSKGKDALTGAKVSMTALERLGWISAHGTLNFVGSFPINQIPGVQLPALIGDGIDTVRNAADAVGSANDAHDAADR